MASRGRLRAENGQASVEFAGVLPLAVVLALVLWQAVVAGQALWLGGAAARSAARAHAIGGDELRAARGALPSRFERGLQVRSRDNGEVEVAVRVPWVAGRGSVATVRASAAMEPQR